MFSVGILTLLCLANSQRRLLDSDRAGARYPPNLSKARKGLAGEFVRELKESKLGQPTLQGMDLNISILAYKPDFKRPLLLGQESQYVAHHVEKLYFRELSGLRIGGSDQLFSERIAASGMCGSNDASGQNVITYPKR
jgi:hypothetical protein